MGTAVELDELPEPIIQHILSFLPTKQAARTTILSNSWRTAWLTQPNLAFRPEYPDHGKSKWDPVTRTMGSPILELATKTIQRYEESNLEIQSLTLFVADVCHNDYVLWNEVIAKSLFLGATHLNLTLCNYNSFVLPHDIVFGSEKLVGLSLRRGKIEKGSSKVIRCSGLESLCLIATCISLDELSNVISSCPSIRKLSLSSINWLIDEEEGVNRSVGLMNLHGLTRLELLYVEFDTLFLGDMSSRFPSLKDLTLHTHSYFSKNKVIRISSRSLERLNFAQEKGHRCEKGRVRYKFYVPSIRRFTYKGSDIPLLSIKTKTTSREWESRVSIGCGSNLGSLWLLRLNKLLTKLRRSKIHLCLWARYGKSFDYEAGAIRGLGRRPRVENLTVDVWRLPTLSCYAFFDGLLQICRPKLITQYLHPPDEWTPLGKKVDSNYFLCKAFLARPGENESHFLYFLYNGLRELEEVNVELFDKEMAVWRHVPLKSLLDDASTSWATDEQKIRFQLKWKRN